MTINQLEDTVKRLVGKLHNERILRAHIDSARLSSETVNSKFNGDWKKAIAWIKHLGLLKGVEDVNQQCWRRFDRSWKQVRKHLFKQVQRIAYAPKHFMRPDQAARGMGLGGTHNWMTDRFLGVLYLHFLSPTVAIELSGGPGKTISASQVSLETLLQEQIMQDLLKMELPPSSLVNESNPLFWEMLRLTPKLCPELMVEVLRSHADVLR